MNFNVSSLEFLKKKSKMSKDELFILGFLIGRMTTSQTILESSGYTSEEAEKMVKEVYSKEKQMEIWDLVSIDLELETRQLHEIMPEFLD